MVVLHMCNLGNVAFIGICNMFIELCNLGIEIFSCFLLLRMARMDMDCKLKQLKPTCLSFDALPTKIAKKILWLLLPDKICVESSSYL